MTAGTQRHARRATVDALQESSASPTAPVLRAQALHKAFDGVQAVDNVSVTVFPGQIVSIIGPNGSGKTTTLNLITGTAIPDAGTVEVVGTPVHGRPPEDVARAGVARTFQHGRVFGTLSVRDNLAVASHGRLTAHRPARSLAHQPIVRWYALLAEVAVALLPGRRVRRERQEMAAAIDAEISRFGQRLGPRRDDPAYTLSYANRRRTEIARALAGRPRLLVLDEPTAGMNETETREMSDQLVALKAGGQAILLVEHKLDLVMRVSDHVLAMDDGVVIAQGPPHVVRSDPRVVEAYLGHRRAQVAQHTETAPRTQVAPRPSTQVGSVAVASHPAVAPAALLSLEDIWVRYGSVDVLSSISLTVGSGELVCLLGGNASGKSTTMRAILGLRPPTRGRVVLDGEDVTRYPTPRRIEAGLASVPEARRVFAQMSVEDNLRMGAHTRRDATAVGHDLREQYDRFPRLFARRRQLAGTLSGGEQQMLAVARALMSRPRLLLMDEPTMGLSPRLVDEVLDLISRLNRDLGTAVLLVEQQAHLALAIAHRGYVLAGGRIVLAGPAARLVDDPAVQEAYLGHGSGTAASSRHSHQPTESPTTERLSP